MFNLDIDIQEETMAPYKLQVESPMLGSRPLLRVCAALVIKKGYNIPCIRNVFPSE